MRCLERGCSAARVLQRRAAFPLAPLTSPQTPQVIKIGTSSLIHERYQTLNLSNLARVCEVIKQLHSEGAAGRAGRRRLWGALCGGRACLGSAAVAGLPRHRAAGRPGRWAAVLQGVRGCHGPNACHHLRAHAACPYQAAWGCAR